MAVSLKWSIQPRLGLVKGDYYFEEARFRQGHMGSMLVVVDSNNLQDVILAEFNESGRPNYYTRLYQNVPKRMSEYNFSMGKKKGTAWVQSALTMEKLMMEKDQLTFELNPHYDPKLGNQLSEPNRLKYQGIDIVAGASNSIQQSMIPLTAKIHSRIQAGASDALFYQQAEKLLDEKGRWTGVTAMLRLVVDKNSHKITHAHYDEIFADEKKDIQDASLKAFYRQSKYDSINYVEPARIGFNVMIDALSSHLKEGGSLFNIADEHKFYGRIDYSVTNSDSGSATHKNKSGTVLENNFTRIGIKGASQLTDSTSLFYQIEVGVNGESQDSGDKPFSARPTFIGVKHSTYGALAVGRIDPVFKMAKGMSDAMDNYSLKHDRLFAGDKRWGDSFEYKSAH